MSSPALPVIDFRSDTVTRPTPEMLARMAAAELGDDVFGDDPSVNALQKRVAELAGKEAALLCVTGTMTNQIGLRLNIHDDHHNLIPEVLCHVNSHVYRYECTGLAQHARAQVFPVGREGFHLTAAEVEAGIHLARNEHTPITSVISIENTMAGQVMPFEEMQKIAAVARKHNIRLHLDGARLFNASVASGVSIADYCALFDTVSLCFSKGLGAPMGSVLVLPQRFFLPARQLRKLMGGGWRQAGLVAAACDYCLDVQLPRLHVDHENAAFLAGELTALGFDVVTPNTNVVLVRVGTSGADAVVLEERLKERNIKLIAGGNRAQMRLVVHSQTDRQACERLVREIATVVRGAQ